MSKRYEKIEPYVYRQCRTYKVVQKGNVLGRFHSLEEALKLKAELLEKGVIRPQRRGPPIATQEDRYIQVNTHRNKTSYTIQKWVDGCNQTFGTFGSLEDAREERDYLESIGWDYDNMETMENMEWEQDGGQ